MPELPEVEVIRRDLQAVVPGRTVLRARVLDTGNAHRVVRRHPSRRDFEAPLQGTVIRRLDRRGKYLLLCLDGEVVLVVHLGMSGQLVLGEQGQPRPKHTHVVIELDAGAELRYVDPRSFGEMFIAGRDPRGIVPELSRLGPDALDDDLADEFFVANFARRRTRVKPLLMDQTFVCGLGNIYSDEVLFLAGVRHDRPAPAVTRGEIHRLREAIPKVLHASIASRGTTMLDEQYRDLYGAPGAFQQQLKVYGRESLPCVVCGTAVRRDRWSNRSTFYCPRCQS